MAWTSRSILWQSSVDPYHLLRSLTFFDDADREAMPEVLRPIRWDAIKSFFRAEAARLFQTLDPPDEQ